VGQYRAAAVLTRICLTCLGAPISCVLAWHVDQGRRYNTGVWATATAADAEHAAKPNGRAYMESKLGTLTDDEISRLFARFSLPMVRPCITAKQKQSAVGIAKIFWLRFVTGTDTEENVYEDLNRFLGNKHDDNVALGSSYFFKMKTALTDEEVRRLKDHYSDDRNFGRLKEWEP